MDRFNDDSQFHEISFEEFEDMIAECSEVEIPLGAFQDFVDEVNGYEENLSDELFGHFSYCESLADAGKYTDAFNGAYELQTALPQQLIPRLHKLYDCCAKHGVIGANAVRADYYFCRWESSADIRGQSFEYLCRLYELGYLPYFWELGYCYLHGIGTPIDKEKAITVLTEGFLYYGDNTCKHYLQGLVPKIFDAFEDGARFYLGIGCEKNFEKAFELLTNAAIYERYGAGYCLARMADIIRESKIDGENARKTALLYKSALKESFIDAPEVDANYNEGEIYYNIGLCYFDGCGVQRDYFKAAWFLDYSQGCLDADDSRQINAEELIKEAYSMAEKLANDDELGEYYRQCFEAGDPYLDYDWDEDEEDDFLFL